MVYCFYMQWLRPLTIVPFQVLRLMIVSGRYFPSQSWLSRGPSLDGARMMILWLWVRYNVVTVESAILFFWSGVQSRAALVLAMEDCDYPYNGYYDTIGFDGAVEEARAMRREEEPDGDTEQRDFLAYTDEKIQQAMVVHEKGRSRFPAGQLDEADLQPDVTDTDLLLYADAALGCSCFLPSKVSRLN